MATTKQDIQKTASGISEFITGIGNTIKENERQRNLSKVMKEFQNPDKLFMNADGTPKSDAEIAPKISQGVMEFYQLGEGKLGDALMSYYTNMSKSLDKDATNVFNYEQYKKDPRFPTTSTGEPMALNPRVDYTKFDQTKQYAPRDKKFYAPKSFNLGDRVKIYEWDADKQIWNVKEEAFNKPANVNYNYSTVNTTVSGQEQVATYTDNAGKTQNIVYRDGTPYYSGTNTKVNNMEGWTPMTENMGFDKSGIDGLVNRVMGSMNFGDVDKNSQLQAYSNIYKNEINNWLNGGVLPSFMTNEWIISNQSTFNDLLKLKQR